MIHCSFPADPLYLTVLPTVLHSPAVPTVPHCVTHCPALPCRPTVPHCVTHCPALPCSAHCTSLCYPLSCTPLQTHCTSLCYPLSCTSLQTHCTSLCYPLSCTPLQCTADPLYLTEALRSFTAALSTATRDHSGGRGVQESGVCRPTGAIQTGRGAPTI